MDKISVARFTKKTIEQTGCKNADAIMLITVNGSDIRTSVAGIDPIFPDHNSVALVAAMHEVLERKFKIADLAYKSAIRHGETLSEFQEHSVQVSDSELAADKPEKRDEVKACSKRDLADDFLEGLIDLMERTLGGDNDAHDA